jgi:hypothetical protein
MRKTLFWTGWVILFVLPIAFTLEVFLDEDLPNIQPWKWAILATAVLLIYFSRNRDDVLKHHVA